LINSSLSVDNTDTTELWHSNFRRGSVPP